MMDINGIKNDFKLNIGFGGKNGNGGQIFIIADKIKGNGKISATESDGLNGGK